MANFYFSDYKSYTDEKHLINIFPIFMNLCKVAQIVVALQPKFLNSHPSTESGGLFFTVATKPVEMSGEFSQVIEMGGHWKSVFQTKKMFFTVTESLKI